MSGALKAATALLVASLDEDTALVRVDDDTQLAVIVERLSSRCTALTLASQRSSPDMVVSGCALVQQSCEDLTALWQLWRRDRAEQQLVLHALRPLVVRALEAAGHLAELIEKKRTKDLSPGTGLVWAACADLCAFRPTMSAAVCVALSQWERHADDTAQEMAALPAAAVGDENNDNDSNNNVDSDDGNDDDDDDDDDDGCTVAELQVAQAATGAIKAARSTLRGCASAVGAAAVVPSAAALLELHRLAGALAAAVEELGCALYHPQDRGAVAAALVALRETMERVYAHLAATVPGERVAKMAAVALALLADAAHKVDAVASATAAAIE